MSKITFETRTLVEVHVEGRSQGHGRTRDDDGLIAKLLAWCMQKQLYAARIQHVGGGALLAYYFPEDATKVIAWLREHECQETE